MRACEQKLSDISLNVLHCADDFGSESSVRRIAVAVRETVHKVSGVVGETA